jgi:predicted transcriptional regulator
MRTITLKLPDALAARVDATVRRRGVSTSALVREALEDRLEREAPGSAGTCLELAEDLRGALSGPADLSSNERRPKGYGR